MSEIRIPDVSSSWPCPTVMHRCSVGAEAHPAAAVDDAADRALHDGRLGGEPRVGALSP